MDCKCVTPDGLQDGICDSCKSIDIKRRNIAIFVLYIHVKMGVKFWVLSVVGPEISLGGTTMLQIR